MSDLKPCPFCQSKKVESYYGIYCDGCDNVFGSEEKRKISIQKCNTRPSPEPAKPKRYPVQIAYEVQGESDEYNSSRTNSLLTILCNDHTVWVREWQSQKDDYKLREKWTQVDLSNLPQPDDEEQQE